MDIRTRTHSIIALLLALVLAAVACGGDSVSSTSTADADTMDTPAAVDVDTLKQDTASMSDTYHEPDTAPQTGTLSVTSTPTGAEIRIGNGTSLGITPLSTVLPIGNYEITPVFDGYALPESPVYAYVSPGQETELDLELWPALAGDWHAFQCFWEEFPATCWTNNINHSSATITYTPGNPYCDELGLAYQLDLAGPIGYADTSIPWIVVGVTTPLCLTEVGPPMVLRSPLYLIDLYGSPDGTFFEAKGRFDGYLRLYRTNAGCSPSCTPGTCGPDGCGGACTDCDPCANTDCGEQCGGSCLSPSNPGAQSYCTDGYCNCVPAKCDQADDCGTDGCGGSCGGSCPNSQTCVNHKCQDCPHNCDDGQVECIDGDVYRCEVTAYGCADWVFDHGCPYTCTNGACSGGSSTTTCGVKSGWCPNVGAWACAGTCGYRCGFDYQTEAQEWEKLGDCRQYGADCSCILYSGTLAVCAHNGNANNLCSTSW